MGDPPEEGPGGWAGGRAVEVAPPDPPAVGAVGHQARGLDVVDEDEVGVEHELLGIDPVHLDPAGEAFVAEHTLRALERRLKRARGRIVGGIAPRDLPARVDTQVAEDRDSLAEDLGRAAAQPPAGDVEEPSPPHAVGQFQYHVHRALRSHLTVVVDPAHAGASSSARSTRLKSRPRTRSSVVRYGSTRWNRSASVGSSSADRK